MVNTNQQSNIYIFKNNSTTGAFTFELKPALATPSGVINLAVGDLDNDGKPDIAVTNVLQGNVSIFKNQTTTSLSFVLNTSLSTDFAPWGITLGDVEGDGKTDIIVAYTQTRAISVLKNNSSSGSFSFAKSSITTTEKTRNIQFGDLNGDAKPDFAFTSTETSKLSAIRSKYCVESHVMPEGPHSICSDTPLRLYATNALGVTYTWKRDGVVIPGETNSFIDPDQSGVYSAVITSSTDGCSKTSQDVSVAIDAGTLGSVSMDPIPAVCEGGTIELKVNAPTGATYKWSGPNGYTNTTTTNTVSITNATSAMAGEYSVVVGKGACTSQPLTANAVVNSLPNPTINPSGSISFCDGASALLSTGSFSTYQWKKGGVNIPGATSSTYTASESGDYSVYVTNGGGCGKESSVKSVNEFSPPTASFTAPSAKCIGEEISFENTSTIEGSVVNYLWNFGDGATSTESHPYHTYTTANTYTVKLTASYSPGCEDVITKTISIVDTPELVITAEGSTEFCAGDSVKLSVPAEFKTYIWSTGKTSPSIYVKKDGEVNVTVTTNGGCTLHASLDVTVLPYPEITVTADKMVLKPGESTKMVASGAFTYTWTPEEGLSDPTANDPVASPKFTTTYTVTGTDDIGCRGTSEITIVVDNKLSVSPPKLFVPSSEEYWNIDQMEYYPECTVMIFNKQGMILYQNKDYSNNPWDGTYKGMPVPEGVYYFVIRCSEGTNDTTGSITIMRQ